MTVDKTCTATFTLSSLVTCDIQLSQTSYVNSEMVTAQVLWIANPEATPVPIEIGLWLEAPGFAPFSFANVGGDGTVILPPGLGQNFGPLPLFEVTPALPRGAYAFGCRMVDPVTGALLGEDVQPFNIQ